jgi:hypothetical protein
VKRKSLSISIGTIISNLPKRTLNFFACHSLGFSKLDDVEKTIAQDLLTRSLNGTRL